ncbi:DNA double-strand break repair nuclease NurA, partial [Methanococcoides sp. SA1]|nr:DNA double-strand break repair nuclease NurA [Methanococcoides sp. SA1]
QLMYWMVVESKEVRIKEDPVARKILQNYIDIMDHHMKKGMPLIGFVKNPEDMQIMITLRDKKGMKHLPWLRDSQFFKNVLSLGKEDNGRNGRWITYTNWFLQPNQFYEGMINSTSPMLDLELRHDLDPEDYAITFFVIYVPMLDVLFKVETPYGFTKDESVRDLITRKVLFDISVNGIPTTLSKVDSLAKIGRSEKELVKGMFKGQRFDNTYNIERWGDITDE